MTRYSTASFTVVAVTLAIAAGCRTSETPGSAVDSAAQSPAQSSTVPPPVEGTSPAAHSSPIASGGTENAVGPDGIAQVVTTDLVVRSAPGVSAESEIYPQLLNEPTLLFVVDGPVAVDGFDWYLVQPFSRSPCLDLDLCPARPFGWVAQAGTDGEPWIAPASVACPEADQPDVFELDALHPYELLYCFGDRQISVAVQAMGICSGYIIGEPNYTIEPAWLGMGSPCGWGREGAYLAAMHPYLEPSVGTQYPPGAERLDWYLLTGQFDHPDAADCVLRELAGGHPQMPPMPDLTAEQVVLGCRLHFAVQRAEKIGVPTP